MASTRPVCPSDLAASTGISILIQISISTHAAPEFTLRGRGLVSHSAISTGPLAGRVRTRSVPCPI